MTARLGLQKEDSSSLELIGSSYVCNLITPDFLLIRIGIS